MRINGKNILRKIGISENASFDEIKRAYRRLAFFYHPDKNGGALKYENIFKEINKIYQTLSDPINRREYDARLRRAREFQPEHVYNPEDFVKPVAKKNKNYRWATIVIFIFLRIIFNSWSSPDQSGNFNSALTDFVSNGSYISNAHSFVLTDTTALLSYLNKTQ